ncbi:sensor histidine kinase [Streptacidiphilus monticola]|uniref:histidine kinase n=1 Tax=Streptacidiphilus monticola TaxID=2161674 RepID=A0ABW1FZY5_9ACTN
MKIRILPSPKSRALMGRHFPAFLTFAFIASLLPTGITYLHGSFGIGLSTAAALSCAQTLPLALAHTRPLQAWLVIGAADLIGALVLLTGHPHSDQAWPWPVTTIIGYLYLLLALSLREPRRVLGYVWAATGAAGFALAVAVPSRDGIGNAVLMLALSGGVLLLGNALRERQLAQRESASQRARSALLEERTRIARELHDVVAHHMSLIAVQADSAPYRITGLPTAAEQEFAAIGTAARESLTEMRRLLGVLRSDDAAVERSPQPGVARLPQLVEATGRAGVPAELSLDPELPALPDALDLSVYRIVQEALSNVIRHAPGAQTWVSLAAEEDELRVTVVNAASPKPLADPVEHHGTGQGLVGMRERVTVLGGQLTTGPLADGGYRVAAVLPLDKEDEK